MLFAGQLQSPFEIAVVGLREGGHQILEGKGLAALRALGAARPGDVVARPDVAGELLRDVDARLRRGRAATREAESEGARRGGSAEGAGSKRARRERRGRAQRRSGARRIPAGVRARPPLQDHQRALRVDEPQSRRAVLGAAKRRLERRARRVRVAAAPKATPTSEARAVTTADVAVVENAERKATWLRKRARRRPIAAAPHQRGGRPCTEGIAATTLEPGAGAEHEDAIGCEPGARRDFRSALARPQGAMQGRGG
jgi:hypothetical protein